LVSPRSVTGLSQAPGGFRVRLDEEHDVVASAVIIASGVRYRRLHLPGLADLEGRGVYYAASQLEAKMVSGRNAVVVGGANSAGQAALNFAKHAKQVTLVVRGADLLATMSTYLVDRITAAPNVTVRCATEVGAADGEDHLERLTLVERTSGDREEVDASWLFVFIGASPRTDWLGEPVARDSHGFVLTGPDVVTSGAAWGLSRAPFALETSMPGVFAAGDVRLDSMKRVASAVGEGAMSIYLVHRYLATI
jgi:thioredoxin reductase (NADPH)